MGSQLLVTLLRRPVHPSVTSSIKKKKVDATAYLNYSFRLTPPPLLPLLFIDMLIEGIIPVVELLCCPPDAPVLGLSLIDGWFESWAVFAGKSCPYWLDTT